MYYLLAGAAGFGGLACFLLACKQGRIKNNKHVRKAMLEMTAGSIVGFFLSFFFHGFADEIRVGIAFAGGSSWAFVLQTVRKKVTDVVSAVFHGIKKDVE